MARNIKDSKIREAIEVLRFEPDTQRFEAGLSAFDKLYGDTSSGKYFLNNYGENGTVAKPNQWCRAYNLNFASHNLFAER